jgi:hypothetical protein
MVHEKHERHETSAIGDAAVIFVVVRMNLEPRMNTDQHRWIWLDDPLAGVFVSGDALAAGCDL